MPLTDTPSDAVAIADNVPAPLSAAAKTDTIPTAVAIADRGLVVTKTDTIRVEQGETVSDALRRNAGLFIGDNGGAAGLKTVSIRGLGSAHTSIYVDGVRVGNVQSGQGDLTNLGAEPFGEAVIDYAQNSISFISQRPAFEYGRKVAGRASLSAGSFGTVAPYGRIDFKTWKNTAVSASAAGLLSRGDFKYGDNLRRENNDIRQFSGGTDVFGLLNGGSWHAKAHFNGSDRGTPGSLEWPSEDRQADRNAYIQVYARNRFSGRYSATAGAKYSFDRLDYKSEWGVSRYDQREAQINTAHKLSVSGSLDFSLAAGFTWDKLDSDQYCAERYSPSASLGASYRSGRLKAALALEYEGAMDKSGLSRNTVSPSAEFRYGILRGLDLSAFGRRACRVPAFNELYYAGYGNPDLHPEDAFLSGTGLSFKKAFGRFSLAATADAFLNLLKDKIISAPSDDNPYVWMPYNIGKVRSIGADTAAGFDFRSGMWTLAVNAKYAFQNATDRTRGGIDFGKQIPYVAKHIVFISASASAGRWKLEASWNLHSGLRDAGGPLPDRNTLDASLFRSMDCRGCGPLTLFVSGRNLSDCRYESVSGYPMPGRSVTGGINFKF